MNFRPTEKSLNLIRQIAEQVPTFHHHYHVLYDIAKEFYSEHKTINYLEIGCYKGASACLMLSRPNTTVISIDSLNASSKEEINQSIALFKNKESKFKLIVGNSQSPETESDFEFFNDGNGIDILFIDAGHKYQDVLNDFSIYSKYLNKNGFIVFDDYNDKEYCPEVKTAVDYLVQNNFSNDREWVVMGTYNNLLGAHPKDMLDGNCFVVRKIV
jgi:predicted O-methyltransferase YrrM